MHIFFLSPTHVGDGLRTIPSETVILESVETVERTFAVDVAFAAANLVAEDLPQTRTFVVNCSTSQAFLGAGTATDVSGNVEVKVKSLVLCENRSVEYLDTSPPSIDRRKEEGMDVVLGKKDLIEAATGTRDGWKDVIEAPTRTKVASEVSEWKIAEIEAWAVMIILTAR